MNFGFYGIFVNRTQRYMRSVMIFIFLVGILLAANGCSTLNNLIFGSAEAEATPTEPPRVLMPTFTSTPQGQAAVPPTATAAPVPATDTPLPVETPTDTPLPEPTATDTPLPSPRLIVIGEIVNVRQGPGTNYGLAGTASANQEFEIVGKSPDGAWWQICCVNGQQVWLFGQLARAENAEAVAVAQNIPPAPQLPTNTPVPPPAPPTPAPPPPAADPCASIGGDGCKFKVRSGPKHGENGGQELKMQLGFIHTGVDGGQAQGSYFVVLLKEGQQLPVGDNVRSEALNKRNGPLGQYNYEYSMGVDKLPGNSVAGNYVMYVLDGNGERDSRDFGFSIPSGSQGLLWIEWDQN